MITSKDKDRFDSCIIGQDDDYDYSESGYVVVVDGDWGAIANYGHCSCYGTWAAITGGGISDTQGPDEPHWDWTGTVEQLRVMVTEVRDPRHPERFASEDDCDFDHLKAAYAQARKWLRVNRSLRDRSGMPTGMRAD